MKSGYCYCETLANLLRLSEIYFGAPIADDSALGWRLFLFTAIFVAENRTRRTLLTRALGAEQKAHYQEIISPPFMRQNKSSFTKETFHIFALE